MNITRLRRTQGCLTDAVAYRLNLHPARVPLFIYPRRGWMRRLKAFYRRRGFAVQWVACQRPPAKGIHVVCGDSQVWKRFAHAVVYRNGQLAFDPNYPSQWKVKHMTHRLVMTRLKEQK